MASTFADPGGSATYDASFWAASVLVNGAVSVDTVHTNGQARSFKCTNTSQGAGRDALLYSPDGVLRDAGSRVSFYFYFDALPVGTANSTNSIALSGSNGDAAAQWHIMLGSDGKLRIQDGAGTVQATGTTVLAINTVYRITIAHTITSATVNTTKVFLSPAGGGPGTLEVTATNMTVTVGSSVLNVGMFLWDCTGKTCNFWFSDVYVDNSAALTDTGDIHVTPKRPNANGTANNWTTQIGSGGSGYGSGHSPQVNERALSTTNGWSLTTASAVTEEYNLEGRTVGDADLTNHSIVDWGGWVCCKVGTATTGDIIVGGATTAISVLTTYAVKMAFAGSTTYPAGSGTDVGIASRAVSSRLWSLAECGGLIISTPGTPQGETLVPSRSRLAPAPITTYAGVGQANGEARAVPVAIDTFAGIAAVRAEGVLTPASVYTAAGAGALTGDSRLAPGPKATYAAVAAISADSRLTPAPAATYAAVAQLTADGRLAPVTIATYAGQAQANGEVLGTPGPQAAYAGGAVVAGDSRAQGAATMTYAGAVTLAEVATLFGAPAATYAGESDVAGIAQLSPAGTMALAGVATATASGLLVPVPVATFAGETLAAELAMLAPAPILTAAGVAQLTAWSILTAGMGPGVLYGETAIPSLAAVLGAPAATFAGSGAIPASAAVLGAGLAQAYAAAAVTASGLLRPASTIALAGAATLPSWAAIIAEGSLSLPVETAAMLAGFAQLAPAGTLTAGAFVSGAERARVFASASSVLAGAVLIPAYGLLIPGGALPAEIIRLLGLWRPTLTLTGRWKPVGLSGLWAPVVALEARWATISLSGRDPAAVTLTAHWEQ